MSLGAIVTTPAWLAGGGPMTGVGFIGFFLWTLVWGVLMMRTPREA